MVAAKKSRVTAKKKTPRSRVGKSSLLNNRFSGKSLFIAAALVVVVGALVVWFAVAATAPQMEPETWNKNENRVAGNMNGCVETLDNQTASGGKYIQFGCSTMPADMDHSMSCTPGIGVMSAMGPCINNTLIPAARAGIARDNIQSVTPIRLSPPTTWGSGQGEPGAFRSRCDFSHMNYDDAVLYYGQPGKAHLHTYFGNTGTNANSTSASLLSSGSSTCAGGTFNRSAYWIPTMIDTASGRPIAPNDDRSVYNSDLEIYYKVGYQGVGYRDIKPFPNGLQMIAGNQASATSEPQRARNGEYPVTYYCEGAAATDRTRNNEGLGIPVCTSGQVLVMDIDFPQCWDGVNLRAVNGRSHIEYGRWHNGSSVPVGTTPISETAGCPPSHPVPMPHVEMFVRWRVPSGTDTRNWRLASDNYTTGPGGYSGHADYVFAWNATAFPTIVNRCYVAQQDCGYQIGDGRYPVTVRGN
jgi:hypothetical protein